MQPQTPTQLVAHWITERESIRVKKETRKPRPWTDDPILRQYRFCNVHREDDKVTRWLNVNWRDPHHADSYLTRAMALARMVNWPPTLAAIGYPTNWDPDHIIDTIHAMKGKAWSAAYIVSTNGNAMDKAVYVVERVVMQIPPMNFRGQTLAQVYAKLRAYNGIGSFMAGQIIADLKNTSGHVLNDAPDWWTWATEGPGSKRGLTRYFEGRPEASAPFIAKLKLMACEVEPLVKDVSGDMCMQDWQNVMCEFDKYMRVKLGQGRPRAGYNPSPDFT